MKKILIYLIAALMMISSFSCKSKGPSNIVVYGTTEKISDLDPAHAYDIHTWDILWNVCKGLLTYIPGTTEIVPGLAESYSVNEAGDVYTFKLREGLTFTDGTPLNAEAVKWSIERVIRLQGDPSWLVSDFVDSVDVIDDLTVQFNLKMPCGFFPALAATITYFPANPSIYPADRIIRDPSELKGGKLVGVGPYSIVSFKRDEEIVLKANPDYFGEKAKVDQIVIRYFADATTMRLALERGEIDLAYKSFNPSDINDLVQSNEFVTNRLKSPYIRYICFETSELVFKDKRLRQAVGALVDRNEIIEKAYLGQNIPLYSMLPSGMDYQTEDFKTTLGDGNIALAEKLLTEAGYSADKPLEFELWYTPSHYGDTEVNMAEIIKVQLEKTPMMKVTLKSAEWAAYKDKWSSKEMAVWLLGWYPDYIDPDNYTAAFAGTSGSKGMGINFSSPQWDALFTKEQSSTDSVERKAVFEEVQKMWTEDCPTIPLWQGSLYVFSKKNVKNVKIGPTLRFEYSELEIE